PRDLTVADRGGYDYRVTVPSSGPGGVVQVYNAAFAPDGTGGSANFCDNNNQNPAARTCAIGGNNWFHEDDSGPFAFGTAANNAASFTGASNGAHKGYAVRAVNGDVNRTACATCQVAGWNEICFFTPFDAGPGGSFTMNLFQLTPDYAGLTVAIDIYDVGDISSSNGRVVINILDPSGAVATSTQGVSI